ncbi:MAG: hypothetical protein AAB229_07320 [Candidatus Hydrogenedentota bacterium]
MTIAPHLSRLHRLLQCIERLLKPANDLAGDIRYPSDEEALNIERRVDEALQATWRAMSSIEEALPAGPRESESRDHDRF